MTGDEIDEYWKTADRISDRVVDLINQELKVTQEAQADELDIRLESDEKSGTEGPDGGDPQE